MGFRKRSIKREVYSDEHLQLKTRKIVNKQLNLTPQGTRKRGPN